jgi:hypothetical protein
MNLLRGRLEAEWVHFRLSSTAVLSHLGVDHVSTFLDRLQQVEDLALYLGMFALAARDFIGRALLLGGLVSTQ